MPDLAKMILTGDPICMYVHRIVTRGVDFESCPWINYCPRKGGQFGSPGPESETLNFDESSITYHARTP